MKFFVEEVKYDRNLKFIDCFFIVLFKKICDVLFDGRYSMKNCIERFVEYLEYDDVRFYVFKNLIKVFGDVLNSEES